MSPIKLTLAFQMFQWLVIHMEWSDNSLSINSQSSIYFEFESLLKIDGS